MDKPRRLAPEDGDKRQTKKTRTEESTTKNPTSHVSQPETMVYTISQHVSVALHTIESTVYEFNKMSQQLETGFLALASIIAGTELLENPMIRGMIKLMAEHGYKPKRLPLFNEDNTKNLIELTEQANTGIRNLNTAINDLESTLSFIKQTKFATYDQVRSFIKHFEKTELKPMSLLNTGSPFNVNDSLESKSPDKT